MRDIFHVPLVPVKTIMRGHPIYIHLLVSAGRAGDPLRSAGATEAASKSLNPAHIVLYWHRRGGCYGGLPMQDVVKGDAASVLPDELHRIQRWSSSRIPRHRHEGHHLPSRHAHPY